MPCLQNRVCRVWLSATASCAAIYNNVYTAYATLLSSPSDWPCREPQFEKSVVRVAYSTRDGQLIGTEKDIATNATSGELVFASDEEVQNIYVHPFQDDNMEYEVGDGFFVDLHPVEGCEIRLLRAAVCLQMPYMKWRFALRFTSICDMLVG